MPGLEQATPTSSGNEEAEAVEPSPTSASRTAPTNSSPGTSDSSLQVDQLWQQLRQRDAQIMMHQKKLQHYKSWVASIQHKFQQSNPQAIKNSRRLYVGGLTPDTTEEELKTMLNNLMIKTGGATAPGACVLSCKINPVGGPGSLPIPGTSAQDKTYAFIEMRNIEETSNAMALDGLAYKDGYLKVRRPSNYDPNVAICLGPMNPDPTMDTASLDICRTVVEDSPHKLFIGGLPCDWVDDQVKELLLPHGPLRSFNLVMDKVTSKSKGYAFCEYADEGLTDFVIKSLNGKKLGNKVMTVKRALEGGRTGTSPQATRGPMPPLGLVSPSVMGGQSPPGTSSGLPFAAMFPQAQSQSFTGNGFTTNGNAFTNGYATNGTNGYTTNGSNGYTTNGTNGMYNGAALYSGNGNGYHRGASPSNSSYGGSPISGGSPANSISNGMNGFGAANGHAQMMGTVMANLW